MMLIATQVEMDNLSNLLIKKYKEQFSISSTCCCDLVIETADTNSIELSGYGSKAFPLTASIKISSFAGNTLTVRDDGLYTTGGGSGTLTAANQGTSLSGTTVQLGQAVGAVGNPATLTSNREIPVGAALPGVAYTIALVRDISSYSPLYPKFSNTLSHAGIAITGVDGGNININIEDSTNIYGDSYPSLNFYAGGVLQVFNGLHYTASDKHYDICDLRGSMSSAQIQTGGQGLAVFNATGSIFIGGVGIGKVTIGRLATAGTAKLNIVASTALAAPFKIENTGAVAPTSPTEGEMWITAPTTPQHLFVRLDGVTYQLDQQITSTLPISGLLAATASNDINNTNYSQIWRWNTKNSYGLVLLANTTTDVSSQALLDVELSGLNASASIISYTANFSNTHTGTLSTNVALRLNAIGGTNNYAIIVDNGLVGLSTSTPTATLEVSTTALGVTQSDTKGILLSNTTAATVGAQQISPAIHWKGAGWKTTATAASQSVDWRAYVLPVQGSTNPSSVWTLERSVNGGAYFAPLTVDSGGNLVVSTSISTSQVNISGGIVGNPGMSISLNGSLGNPGDVITITGGSPQWTALPGSFALTSESGTTVSGSGTGLDWTGSLLLNSVIDGADTYYIEFNNLLSFKAGTVIYTDGLIGMNAGAKRAWLGDRISVNNGTFILVDDDQEEIILKSDTVHINDVNTGSAVNGDVWTLQDNTNGRGRWVTSPATPIPLNSLLAATGTNTIDNGNSIQSWDWNTLSGTGFSFGSNSAAANFNNQIVLSVNTQGANSNSTQTTYGIQVLNQHTGTASSNVAGYFAAANGTNNYAIIVPATFGKVGFGIAVPTASILHIVAPSNGSTTASGVIITSAATTSGTIMYMTSSTLTSGNLVQLTSTSTALIAGNEMLDIAVSGINATNAITVTGARISVTNTNATSGTNVALDLTASGATTDNIAVLATGAFRQTYTGTTGTTTSAGHAITANSITTGNALYVGSSSITSGSMVDFLGSSNAAASNTQTILSVRAIGTNASSGQTTIGVTILNQQGGTTSTAVGLKVTAANANNLYAIIVPSGAGSVGIGTSTPVASALDITSAATTAVTTASIFTINANSLTSGTAIYLASSSLSSGKMIDVIVTGTGALTGQTGINISISGATSTNAQTTYGMDVSNTRTNATSGTNRGIRVTATGATTGNVALEVIGSTGSSSNFAAMFTGRVGMGGITAPQADLEVGGSIITQSFTISAAAGGSNGNMFTGSTNVLTNSTNAQYLILSAASMGARIYFAGTGTTAITTNATYGTVVIGAAAVPEASSGTHALIASLILIPPAITGAAATVTKTATLYIDDAPTATVADANYALYIRQGATYMGGIAIYNATIRLKNYTVATLPAGVQGDVAYVTDALTPTFLTAAVGGGAVVSPVFYNGAAWVTV